MRIGLCRVGLVLFGLACAGACGDSKTSGLDVPALAPTDPTQVTLVNIAFRPPVLTGGGTTTGTVVLNRTARPVEPS